MPQGRRKVPFSGKAKKKQLQVKKAVRTTVSDSKKPVLLVESSGDEEDESSVEKLNFQPNASKTHKNLNRYVLQFHKESEKEILERKEQARHSLVPVDEISLEICIGTYFPQELDFPKRPPWDYSMTKEQLDARENRHFTEYTKKLENQFSWKNLSYFELNLETWRQLWRVLEMSDIVLIIVDARYPALMFPPSLYNHVIEMKKEMIMVLNKVDLVPEPLIVAWKSYFLTVFPKLHIVYFTSLPSYNLRGNATNRSGLITRRKRGRMKMVTEAALKLLEVCQSIVEKSVDLSSWEEKIREEMNLEDGNDEIDCGETLMLTKQDTSYTNPEKFSGGVLTIGCVGQPNVGKSSLMNALMGRKVVSVSRTPGHTKHFQTIYLTKTVRLCDCPGLVFPSKVPKSLQVLMGSFPIAQLREPYTSIRFLAERVDLVKLLQLKHPYNDTEWSAMDICDGWALKRHYYTARAARLDSYRAANHLLRMSLDGKICLYLYPPGYTRSKDEWINNPEVETLKWVRMEQEDVQQEIAEKQLEPSEESELSDDGSAHNSRNSVETSNESSSDDLPSTSNKFYALKLSST